MLLLFEDDIVDNIVDISTYVCRFSHIFIYTLTLGLVHPQFSTSTHQPLSHYRSTLLWIVSKTPRIIQK